MRSSAVQESFVSAGLTLGAEAARHCAGADAELTAPTRFLCASLGRLSQTVYAALGGARCERQVGLAGALLSILSKVDDQCIDALRFHGRAGDVEELERMGRRHLGPSLASLLDARPALDEARCRLAADTGALLWSLGAEEGPKDALREELRRGWEHQLRTLLVFTRDPVEVGEAEVARLTADTCASWFQILALVGTLPEDARRGLAPGELDAIGGMAWRIQLADNLCDLEKDLRAGLRSTWPALILDRRAGPSIRVDPRAEAQDLERALGRAYRAVRSHEIDREALLTEAERARWSEGLAALGAFWDHLLWLHGFLLGRYLAHPRCARSASDSTFAPQTVAPPAGFAAAAAGRTIGASTP
jgi:hypothetical protein